VQNFYILVSLFSNRVRRMRCAVLEKPLDRFLLKEADTPEPKGFEVIVRVKSAGLCHTDVHIWEGHYGPLSRGEGYKISIDFRA
jgi:propanol-preferring alcohol dehydrogenase